MDVQLNSVIVIENRLWAVPRIVAVVDWYTHIFAALPRWSPQL
jgi:hypothetical protein